MLLQFVLHRGHLPQTPRGFAAGGRRNGRQKRRLGDADPTQCLQRYRGAFRAQKTESWVRLVVHPPGLATDWKLVIWVDSC